MHKISVLTLMRKGSRRFPEKVLADLCGQPLYIYTVDLALALGFPYYLAHDFDDLYLPRGVNEIKREPQYAGDTHKTNEEILKIIPESEYYVFLQATSPIRYLPDVSFWIDDFIGSEKYDVGFAAKVFAAGYYYNLMTNQGVNFNQNERTDNGCRKDLVCKETGSFYIFKRCQLFKKHILDSDNRIIYPDKYCFDIDTREDLGRLERELNANKIDF